MRLIDAEELTEMAWRERLDTRERIVNLIARQPTIEAKPVKRGKWISLDYDTYFECSVCKNIEDIESNFCSRCGADMQCREWLKR